MQSIKTSTGEICKNKWSVYKEGERICGHSVCEYNGNMYIFGGSDNTCEMTRTTRVFNIETKKWSVLDTTGPTPAARNFHASVLYKRNFYIHGGKSSIYHSDFYVLNLKTKKWSKINQKGTIPSPRFGHKLVQYKGSIYLFGGYRNDGFTCNELYKFNIKTCEWTKINLKYNHVNTGRHHHVFFVWNNSLYIHGGKGDGDIYSKDLIQISLETNELRTIPTMGDVPSERYGHAGEIIGDTLFIQGGKGKNKNFLGDFYKLDLENLNWTLINDDELPLKQKIRAFHSSAIHGSDLYFFWGDINNFRLKDTIVYHTDLTPIIETTSPRHSIESNKTKKRSKEIILKYQFDGEIRVMTIPKDINYNDFVKLLSEECGSTGLKIQYRDDDSDLITIRSALDLQEAIKYFSNSNVKVKLILSHDSLASDKNYSSANLFDKESIKQGSESGNKQVTEDIHHIPESFPKKWKRGELLGKGAYGKVYLGMDTETGELLAIKQVSLNPSNSNEHHIRSLQSEINMLKTLSHKNIVRYLGSEITDNHLNIFLEYQAGGSIASLISKFQKLSENVIRKFTKQILCGLDYLHNNGIAHRDIKGANILVDTDGNIKLADFGASKRLADLVSVNDGFKTVVGSPYWMAPEVIQGGPSGGTYGRKADIWSVGAVVIEMATGSPPFYSLTPVNALFKIGSSSVIPEIPDHLSPEAQDFILQCFQRDVSKRPTTQELLLHPFVNYDSNEEKRSNTPAELIESLEVSDAISHDSYSFNTMKSHESCESFQHISSITNESLGDEDKILSFLKNNSEN